MRTWALTQRDRTEIAPATGVIDSDEADMRAVLSRIMRLRVAGVLGLVLGFAFAQVAAFFVNAHHCFQRLAVLSKRESEIKKNRSVWESGIWSSRPRSSGTELICFLLRRKSFKKQRGCQYRRVMRLAFKMCNNRTNFP